MTRTLTHFIYKSVTIWAICSLVAFPVTLFAQVSEEGIDTENAGETDVPVVTPDSTEQVADDVASEEVVEATSTPDEVEVLATSTPEQQNESESVNASSTASSTPDVTYIGTGDATATAEINTEANANTIDTGTSTASSTDIASTTSQVEIENVGTTTAETGDNIASSTETTYIDTGNALATLQFINLLNTNIYNSEGFLILLNLLFGENAFDLRDLDFTSFANEPQSAGSSTKETIDCSLSGCSSEGVTYSVISSSTATVTNSYIVRASTGGNSASGDTAVIRTGDAYALANGINVVNSNFINSHYLLISVNNIGDYIGDLVLPSAQFFSKFLSQLSTATRSENISITNNANITNNIDGLASTGDNTVSATGAAVVDTGDACAYVNLDNTVNQNIVGSSLVNILIRVDGDWNGHVFGLPDGLLWERTGSGIRIYNELDGAASTTSVSTASVGTTTIHNDATIENNIKITALTGENEVTGGDGLVQTGDACVAANIQNIANTNVIGSNWLSAFFNILGNFKGDIAFGRPDLWIGGMADLGSEYAGAGSSIKYTYTIINNGDATASDVVLSQLLDPSLTAPHGGSNTTMGTSSDPRTTNWDIGDIAPGETVEVQYTTTVASTIPAGVTPLALQATVSGYEPDNDTSDNTETLTIMARGTSSGGGGGGGSSSSGSVNVNDAPDIEITKTIGTSTDVVFDRSTGDTEATTTPVTYTVTIDNQGGRAYNAILHDTITASDGTSINEQSWDLGTIEAEEEITVTYTVTFADELADGLYTNAAWLEAYERDDDPVKVATSSASVRLIGTPLTITDVTVNATGELGDSQSALITWHTNAPADSTIVYGVGGDGGLTTIDPTETYAYKVANDGQVTDHQILLTGLTPGVTYGFRAVSKTGNERVYSDEGLFTIPALPLPVTPLMSHTTTPNSLSVSTTTGQVLGAATTTDTELDNPFRLRVANAQGAGLGGNAGFCRDIGFINAAIIAAVLAYIAAITWVRLGTDLGLERRDPYVSNLVFAAFVTTCLYFFNLLNATCSLWPLLAVALLVWAYQTYADYRANMMRM